jgi:hypothetical protein
MKERTQEVIVASVWSCMGLFCILLLAGCLDNQNPRVLIQELSYYTNATHGNIRFTVLDDNPTTNCTVYVNQAVYNLIVPNNTLTSVPVTLFPGSNTIVVSCVDYVGNEGRGVINIYSDSQAPEIVYLDFQETQ